jgi:hypothetical protein
MHRVRERDHPVAQRLRHERVARLEPFGGDRLPEPFGLADLRDGHEALAALKAHRFARARAQPDVRHARVDLAQLLEKRIAVQGIERAHQRPSRYRPEQFPHRLELDLDRLRPGAGRIEHRLVRARLRVPRTLIDDQENHEQQRQDHRAGHQKQRGTHAEAAQHGQGAPRIIASPVRLETRLPR